ncbi:hypothetical protein [Segatella buccae]|jgi:hypothetical protein|uniref:hypothetical protein n=1 Tax=Segatella buccae TaxID=28126 RepID=UPI0022DF0024|nr:hypothetical protein [Segatella buccae]
MPLENRQQEHRPSLLDKQNGKPATLGQTDLESEASTDDHPVMDSMDEEVEPRYPRLAENKGKILAQRIFFRNIANELST